MKKTYLNELTSEDLKALFKNNEHLQELANELYQDSVMFWIGEELETFKAALIDWEIGFDCRYNYIVVKDHSLFIESYKEYIEFYSSDDQTIAAVNEANEYRLNNYQDDDYNEKIEEFAHKLEKRLIAYFKRCLIDCDDEDVLIEYLDNSSIPEDFYILNDDLSVIYEDITNSYS